ncbi:MAG TPA: hypothetical protein VGY13_09935 [Solirubrobacteraceae bacterium]|jgi:hypothetical protein|nr:hypothetical protein [Solirubrobacteraceae bacterium]
MDPIHPILPGPTPITDRLPVQPIERVSRERDRPGSDQQGRRRAPPEIPPEPDEEDEDGRPHVDVRA